MCGRMCCTLFPQFLIHHSGSDVFDPSLLDFRPKWNCTPKSKVIVCYQVCDESDGAVLRVLASAVWSIIPPFASDPFKSSGYSTFNARAESLIKNKIYRYRF
eukprot:Gregarina_sp_Poly_1__4050@NODE_2227_length_2459_cov_116_854515_g1369_i1_p2_GENE_NODE_2227_length_2459_cov_116_854515_g1369_i1NODE_2227_length_2459_cov_116_854515_g1369_i1_p2_ORF_typecomplete_len102_score4_58SRAP/PF02586_14/1_9e13_NODE_2227_length_2459_cov_116_854515_g1369_i119042209